MLNGIPRPNLVVLGLAAQMVVAAPTLAADVYKATARFTNSDGERVTAPVTIHVDGTTSEAERTALVESTRAHPESAKAALAGQKQLGYIEARDRRVPIRYAYVQSGGEGRFVTVISDEALGYIGADKKYPKPKEGFDLTYANLMLNASGSGRGEIAPASKVKFMPSGAPAVEDYGSQVVWLDEVTKVTEP